MITHRALGTRLPWLLAALCAAGSCGQAPSLRNDDASASGVDSRAPDLITEPTDDAGAVDPGADVGRCLPPSGVSGSPGTIAAALALMNALPQPLTLTCFLESLDRPLNVAAANSVFSLQPAFGSRSPRFFVSRGKLLFSVVPEGDGSTLVEFGEFVDDMRTIKGEVVFPVEAPLPPDAPFEHLTSSVPTVCGGCHAREEPLESADYPAAFSSVAIRPADSDRVEVSFARQQSETCNAQEEPNRCAILRSIFAHGPVVPWDFPSALPTIF